MPNPSPIPSWRLAAAALATVFAALLAGCGGGSEGNAEAPPQSERPTLAGRVTDGRTATDVRSLQITVKGNVGTARTAEGRAAPVDGSDYLASLDQLSGPYLLSDSAVASTYGLYSVATGPGVANLTPLTTLLVAQLLGQEPGAYFAALGNRGGFTQADAAAVAAAQQRVRRYLQREFGFELPADLGDFVTTPFDRVDGDRMYDTLRSLVARIGQDGDVSAVVSALAQESGRCRVEQISVRSGAHDDAFCPFTKSNAADPDDAELRVLGFANRHGDTLTLRLRDAVLVDLRFASAEGETAACSGSACSGVTVGAAADGGVRTLSFDATVLAGPGGTLTLAGSLRSAAAGVELPGLPCTANFYYLVDAAAGSAEGFCATPDDFGLGAAGQSQPSGATRRVYTFGDGSGGPSLEVVVQGDAVVRALVYTTDPDTGAAVARYQCRDGGCGGVTLGAETVDESLGLPILLRPMHFDGAQLHAVLPDDSLSAESWITVQAELTGYHYDDPSALPLSPLPCAAGAPSVVAAPSDQAATVTICEPADTQGFQLRSTSRDEDGQLVLGIAGLLSDGAGSYVSANSLVVALTPSGSVAYAFFDAFGGPRYECRGSGCAGITVTGPDAAGERQVRLDATVLQETGTGGLAADRSATLDGSFVAPPEP
ncbi:hypothetical protein [Rubrivivax gelatinosus]|uniref:Lipoprotein n=1 Tax=Rubrivivax gelatinosus (strain NBRC 100245 / IL144) TaxID=983917 RepID=I0HQU3_RUBGI|nr:hypothetical protein [Rubrivivax gelatinosus]BAL95380.1 hypothetical protein RGE_20390 [Rubrivivax gelatinosus IL144]